MIDSVSLLSAEFQHLLPVGLLALIFCQTIHFQYFCRDKFLFNNVNTHTKKHTTCNFVFLHFNLLSGDNRGRETEQCLHIADINPTSVTIISISRMSCQQASENISNKKKKAVGLCCRFLFAALSTALLVFR